MPLSREMSKALKDNELLLRPTREDKFMITARAGVHGYSFANYMPLYDSKTMHTIYVQVDGVMMMEGHDYKIDLGSREIYFDKSVHYLDGGEKIVISSSGPDVDGLLNAMLLPRKMGTHEFSQEDLSDYLHEIVGQVFDADTLLEKYADYNKDLLALYAGRKLQVLSAVIREEGLIATGLKVVK